MKDSRCCKCPSARLLVAWVAGISACSAPEPEAATPIALAIAADLDRLTGEPWVGSFSRLDPAGPRTPPIRSNLVVLRDADQPLAWTLRIGYGEQPESAGGKLLQLSPDGQRLGAAALVERTESAGGIVRITTEEDGQDDRRPARLRTVYRIEPGRFSLQAFARPQGARDFSERGTHRWHRGPVDLRPELAALGLLPRPQGARGTCSVFTACSAIEVALAKLRGRPQRLSVEFLNWAASQAAGAPSDGAFFHNALAGFERFGLCSEEEMPYLEVYDPALAPSPAALAQAAALREESRAGLAVHWIVPWEPNRFGVNDAQFAAIKAALDRGFPVAAGSGHSRLLVGYRDDPALPGGGAFLTQDSALARFDEVSYEFVRKEVADVFWVEALSGDL